MSDQINPPPTTPPISPALARVVERFDHVSMAVWDIRDALALVELMGGQFRDGGDVDAGFRWAQWYLPGSGKLEMIQPLDPTDGEHFLVRFLRDRGPGLHHLTFKVTDLLEAVDHARGLGFEVIGVSTDGDWKEAFVYPTSSHGTLIQLAEWVDQPPEALPGGAPTLEDILGPGDDA